MQRIARITHRPPLLPSLSAGIRSNSTEVHANTRTVKRTVRVPLAQWGDIRIPSIEEVRAKAAAKTLKPSYAPDISYLDNASNNYLATKLARLGRGETVEEGSRPDEIPRPIPTPDDIAALTAKRREERQMRSAEWVRPIPTTPDDVAALTAKRREERQMRSAEEARPIPTPDDVAALTAKRREERQMRSVEDAQQYMLNYVPVPEKSELLRSEFAKSNAFMSPERKTPKHRENLFRRPPQDWGPATEQMGASRRNERPRKQHEKVGYVKRPEANKTRSRAPVARATGSVTPSIVEEGIDESVFQPGGHEPEFNGPERPSSNLLDHFGPSFSVTVVAESGTAIKIPISKVDSFYKGDYARYVSASEDYTSSPDVLGAVKVAERTLSHQRHYDLTARGRTMELVAEASQSSKPIELSSRP